MYLRLGVKLILTIFTKSNFVWVPKQIFNCSLKVSLNYCTNKTWSSGKSVNLVELSLFQSRWYGVGTYSGLGDYSFFSACKVEGYWRWALTWGWALYQINNMVFYFLFSIVVTCNYKFSVILTILLFSGTNPSTPVSLTCPILYSAPKMFA